MEANYVGSAFMLIFIVITTDVVARFTTLFIVALFATPLTAIVTTLLAAAIVPNCVSQHV